MGVSEQHFLNALIEANRTITTAEHAIMDLVEHNKF